MRVHLGCAGGVSEHSGKKGPGACSLVEEYVALATLHSGLTQNCSFVLGTSAPPHPPLLAPLPSCAQRPALAGERKAGVQPVSGQSPRVGGGREGRLAASGPCLRSQARGRWVGRGYPQPHKSEVLPGPRPPTFPWEPTGPSCRERLPRKRRDNLSGKGEEVSGKQYLAQPSQQGPGYPPSGLPVPSVISQPQDLWAFQEVGGGAGGRMLRRGSRLGKFTWQGLQAQLKQAEGEEKAGLGCGDVGHRVQEGVEESEGVWAVGRQPEPFLALLQAGSKQLCWEIELKQNLLPAQKHSPQRKGKKTVLALNKH